MFGKKTKNIPYEASKQIVRDVYPNSKVEYYGGYYYVRNGEPLYPATLGEHKSTPEETWINAARLVNANV